MKRAAISPKVWGAVKRGKILCAGFKRSDIVNWASERWSGYEILSGTLTLYKSAKRRKTQ